MLRQTILFILLLVFAVWLGVLLGQDPGVAVFVWKDTSVQTPLWFAAVLLLFFTYLVWQLSRLSSAVPHSVYRYKNWRHLRRQNRACRETGQGLLDLLEGRFSQAESRLGRSAILPGLQTVNYLGAAYAAHKQGALDRRDAWMAHTRGIPEASVIWADFALPDHQKAFIILKHLDQKRVAVLTRLQKACRHLGRWDVLYELVPALKKRGVISEAKADRLERRAAREWLASADKKGSATINAIWKKFPRHLREDPRLIRIYVRQMKHDPASLPALAKLITSTLPVKFDSGLVRLYGELNLADPKKQLQQAEKWLKTYPDQPALLLALGQLALRNQLWGKARGYFNDCLQLDKKSEKYHAEAYAGLGWLDEQAGDLQKALASYREGMKENA